MHPLRCGNYGGRPQQRLLWSGQRGGRPGVGADHIDHPVILVSGFAGPWPLAQALLQARIAQARSYTADPVTLPFAAEQRLNDLMEEA